MILNDYITMYVGSKTLPFILHPRDEDILTIVQGISKEIIEYFKEERKKVKKKTLILKCFNNFNTKYYVENNFLYVYLNEFAILISNNNIDFEYIKNKYSIYEDNVWSIVKEKIIEMLRLLSTEYILGNIYFRKELYHILNNIWFRENYKKENKRNFLTDYQIEIVNKVHDRELNDDEILKLVDYIKEKLKNID